MRFPRNEFGAVDIGGGNYSDKKKGTLKVKYTKEVRFCFGVASVESGDGTVRGVRCAPFDYSGKTLLSIEEFDTKLAEEIIRVRSLKGNGAPWVTRPKKDNTVYRSSDITTIKKFRRKWCFEGIWRR